MGHFEYCYFFSRNLFTPYAAVAARANEMPPSIGVSIGSLGSPGPCAFATQVVSIIAVNSMVGFIFFIFFNALKIVQGNCPARCLFASRNNYSFISFWVKVAFAALTSTIYKPDVKFCTGNIMLPLLPLQDFVSMV